jgi:hypothetical protein
MIPLPLTLPLAPTAQLWSNAERMRTVHTRTHARTHRSASLSGWMAAALTTCAEPMPNASYAHAGITARVAAACAGVRNHVADEMRDGSIGDRRAQEIHERKEQVPVKEAVRQAVTSL